MRLQPVCFFLLVLAGGVASSPLVAAESRSQSQARAGYEFAGSWTLTLDCPAAMRRQLPPFNVVVPGPSFSTRFDSDGQAIGQIVDGRLALKISFTTSIGESVKGELVLNENDGVFRGGGLLTGFGASTYGGGGGGSDRQCQATMLR